MFESYRDRSKRNWGTESETITREDLVFGCTLRIADACEKMSLNYSSLLADVKRLTEQVNGLRSENQRLQRSVSAYKGIIKRRKRS